MTSDVILAGAVTVVCAAVGASLLVGFEAGRLEQIACAWADGCAQFAAWRTALAKLLGPLAAPFTAVWDWVSEVAVPHGTRRKEATR